MSDDYVKLQEELVKLFKNHYVYKRDLFRVVNIVRDVFEIYTSTSIFSLYSNLEHLIQLEFHEFKDPRLGGFIVKNDPPEKSFVCLNTIVSPQTLEFSAGHELFHWFFHPTGEIKCKQFGFASNSLEEYQANEGAAELFLPYKSFIPDVCSRIKHISEYDYHSLPQMKIDLAEHYGVSEAVVSYRMEDLKYEIHQYLDGVDINQLEILSNKELHSRNIVVKSLNELEYESCLQT